MSSKVKENREEINTFVDAWDLLKLSENKQICSNQQDGSSNNLPPRKL